MKIKIMSIIRPGQTWQNKNVSFNTMTIVSVGNNLVEYYYNKESYNTTKIRASYFAKGIGKFYDLIA